MTANGTSENGHSRDEVSREALALYEKRGQIEKEIRDYFDILQTVCCFSFCFF